MTAKFTFESLMLEFASNRNLHQVFTDFLTTTLAAFTQNPSRTLLMETYSRYPEAELKSTFPKLLQQLRFEINARAKSAFGNDVLGEFYESHISTDDEKRILSWNECLKTTQFPGIDLNIIPRHWPIGMLDVGCRSGRIMLATSGKNDLNYEFMGVDYDWDFITMATLNLFFNFHKNAEILWVDPNNSYAFKESYRISLFPQGIIRILDRDKSKVWPHYQVYRKAKKMVSS